MIQWSATDWLVIYMFAGDNGRLVLYSLFLPIWYLARVTRLIRPAIKSQVIAETER